MYPTLTTQSSLNAPIPFDQGRYTGAITCTIRKSDCALLISAVGERISLETFTSPYSEDFKKKFTHLITKNPELISRPEFISLIKIFQNPENVKNYFNGKIHTDTEIITRLDRDSLRPLQGDCFTGFGVVDKQTGEVIGRAAVGWSDKAGESSLGFILRKDYHGKKFGKETAMLMAALAAMYFKHQFPVGNDKQKAPVTHFTATVLNGNSPSRKILETAAKKIRVLPSGWFQRILHFLHIDRFLESIGYPLRMRSLYEIRGSAILSTLSTYMDINKLHMETMEMGK